MSEITWNMTSADPAICDSADGDGYAVVADEGQFVVIVGGMGDLVGYRRAGDREWVDHFDTVEDARDAAQRHFEAQQ